MIQVIDNGHKKKKCLRDGDMKQLEPSLKDA